MSFTHRLFCALFCLFFWSSVWQIFSDYLKSPSHPNLGTVGFEMLKDGAHFLLAVVYRRLSVSCTVHFPHTCSTVDMNQHFLSQISYLLIRGVFFSGGNALGKICTPALRRLHNTITDCLWSVLLLSIHGAVLWPLSLKLLIKAQYISILSWGPAMLGVWSATYHATCIVMVTSVSDIYSMHSSWGSRVLDHEKKWQSFWCIEIGLNLKRWNGITWQAVQHAGSVYHVSNKPRDDKAEAIIGSSNWRDAVSNVARIWTDGWRWG